MAPIASDVTGTTGSKHYTHTTSNFLLYIHVLIVQKITDTPTCPKEWQTIKINIECMLDHSVAWLLFATIYLLLVLVAPSYSEIATCNVIKYSGTTVMIFIYLLIEKCTKPQSRV